LTLTLYLIRHGQTDCSLQNRMCGAGIDSPLNAAGQAMAAALGESLAPLPWTAICSSPMLRARQTAAPRAARTGLPVQTIEGLQEIAYGSWDGRLESEVEASEPDAWANWQRDSGGFSPPGGENAHDLAARAMPAIERIRAAHNDGLVVAFAHKAVIRVIVCALLGIDVGLFRKRVDCITGAATVFHFRADGPLLHRLNDVSYLPPNLREAGGT
jgi:broad specificity phosphatase PhoE